MGVTVESFNGRFHESTSQSINAGKSLPSQFPPPSVPPREVVRCQSCSLVQFRTVSDLCRRCQKPLSPQLADERSDTPDAAITGNAGDSFGEAFSEASGSLPGQSPLKPLPIGRTVKRMRRMRGVSQGELGLRVGLRRTYLSRVENGHVMPGPRLVAEIAQALGVDMSDLVSPQPARGGNGAALRAPDCVRLVEMFSELQPDQMAEIVSKARQMCTGTQSPMELMSAPGSGLKQQTRVHVLENASAA